MSDHDEPAWPIAGDDADAQPEERDSQDPASAESGETPSVSADGDDAPELEAGPDGESGTDEPAGAAEGPEAEADAGGTEDDRTAEEPVGADEPESPAVDQEEPQAEDAAEASAEDEPESPGEPVAESDEDDEAPEQDHGSETMALPRPQVDDDGAPQEEVEPEQAVDADDAEADDAGADDAGAEDEVAAESEADAGPETEADPEPEPRDEAEDVTEEGDDPVAESDEDDAGPVARDVEFDTVEMPRLDEDEDEAPAESEAEPEPPADAVADEPEPEDEAEGVTEEGDDPVAESDEDETSPEPWRHDFVTVALPRPEAEDEDTAADSASEEAPEPAAEELEPESEADEGPEDGAEQAHESDEDDVAPVVRDVEFDTVEMPRLDPEDEEPESVPDSTAEEAEPRAEETEAEAEVDEGPEEPAAESDKDDAAPVARDVEFDTVEMPRLELEDDETDTEPEPVSEDSEHPAAEEAEPEPEPQAEAEPELDAEVAEADEPEAEVADGSEGPVDEDDAARASRDVEFDTVEMPRLDFDDDEVVAAEEPEQPEEEPEAEEGPEEPAAESDEDDAAPVARDVEFDTVEMPRLDFDDDEAEAEVEPEPVAEPRAGEPEYPEAEEEEPWAEGEPEHEAGAAEEAAPEPEAEPEPVAGAWPEVAEEPDEAEAESPAWDFGQETVRIPRLQLDLLQQELDLDREEEAEPAEQAAEVEEQPEARADADGVQPVAEPPRPEAPAAWLTGPAPEAGWELWPSEDEFVDRAELAREAEPDEEPGEAAVEAPPAQPAARWPSPERTEERGPELWPSEDEFADTAEEVLQAEPEPEEEEAEEPAEEPVAEWPSPEPLDEPEPQAWPSEDAAEYEEDEPEDARVEEPEEPEEVEAHEVAATATPADTEPEVEDEAGAEKAPEEPPEQRVEDEPEDRPDRGPDREYSSGVLPRPDLTAPPAAPSERTSVFRPIETEPSRPDQTNLIPRSKQPPRQDRPGKPGPPQETRQRPAPPRQPTRRPQPDQTQIISLDQVRDYRPQQLAPPPAPPRVQPPQPQRPAPPRPAPHQFAPQPPPQRAPQQRPPAPPRPAPPQPTQHPDQVEPGAVAPEVARPGIGRVPKKAMIVALAVVVLAGVALVVPGVRDLVGLSDIGEPDIAPPAAPVSFQPSLRAPGSSGTAPTPQGVSAALEGLASASILGTFTGSVIDPATGKALWERDATTPLTPASTGKLLTAAAALLTLDHTQQFVTKVVAGDQPGTVVIVGGGDPTLSVLPVGKDSVYPGAPHLDELVAQVKANAAGSVSQVLVDLDRYQGDPLAPGWLGPDIADGYIAPIVPAMLDGGRTKDPRNPDDARTNNPSRALATEFARRIGAAVPQKAEGRSPQSTKVLGEVRSAPLVELVDTMLLTSDNVLTETVGREVAKASGEPASFEGATRSILKILRDNGFDTTGASMSDSSGLSTQDKIPAGLLSSILSVAAAADGTDPRTVKLRPLLGGLPVAGGSGTLSGRYQTAPSAAGKGWVRAKTGTLPDAGANSLGGVVLDADGRLLVFALMSNNKGADPNEVRAALDALAAALRGCGCG